VRARVKVKSDASEETIREILARVVKYLPIGLTLSRPVDVKTELIHSGSPIG